jgi:hypothetical protein
MCARLGRALVGCLLMASMACPPAVASGSQPGAPCSDSTVSAENQYCQDVPGAAGPEGPGARGPSLGSTLPPSTVSRVESLAQGAPGGTAGQTQGAGHSLAARHAAGERRVANTLLTLPAPAVRLPIGASPASTAGGWSLFPWLIGVLVAVGLGAIAVVARRRLTS